MKRYGKTSIKPRIFRKSNQTETSNGFQRIYHNHIRKCAGTSINIAMILAMGGNESTYSRLAKEKFHKSSLTNGPVVGWNTHEINRGSFFYAFSHEPLHKLVVEESTFVFCFLRDPIDRVVSHYRTLKDLVNEGGRHPALKSEEAFAFGDFDHFLDNIPRKHLEAQLFNFSGQYNVEEAVQKLRKTVNYVGDIRSANEELIPFLSSEFGLTIDYQHVRPSKFKFKPSLDQYERLKCMLSNEFEFRKQAEPYFGFNLKP